MNYKRLWNSLEDCVENLHMVDLKCVVESLKQEEAKVAGKDQLEAIGEELVRRLAIQYAEEGWSITIVTGERLHYTVPELSLDDLREMFPEAIAKVVRRKLRESLM